MDEAKRKAENARIVATGAEIEALRAQKDVLYDSLDQKAKIDYSDPETAAGLGATGAYGVGIGGIGLAGMGTGAVVGSAFGPVGTAIGAIIGGAIGAIGGAITVGTTGWADNWAENKEYRAGVENDLTQGTVEGIARALADGKIYNTGYGYEFTEGYTQADLYEYGIKENEDINEFYSELKDATTELKDFGKSLNEIEAQEKTYYDAMAVQMYQTVDRSDWSDAADAIGDNILDSASLRAARDKKYENLEGTDFLDKNLSSDMETRLTKSIQSMYGADAKLEKGENGYEIVNSEGTALLENVTSDSLRNIIATEETKAERTEAAKAINKVPEELQKSLDNALGTNVTTESIVALLDNEHGDDLTKEQYDMFSKLPDEKLEEAEFLKNFGVLTYVGDGINDAPVMAASDCAISLGKLGSAAAVETSDVVLVSDDLRGVLTCLRVAKKTRSIVRENIIFSIVMKVVCMALGAAGVLPLAVAVFADVGVMLLAVCNSLRARRI